MSFRKYLEALDLLDNQPSSDSNQPYPKFDPVAAPRILLLTLIKSINSMRTVTSMAKPKMIWRFKLCHCLFSTLLPNWKTFLKPSSNALPSLQLKLKTISSRLCPENSSSGRAGGLSDVTALMQILPVLLMQILPVLLAQLWNTRVSTLLISLW